MNGRVEAIASLGLSLLFLMTFHEGVDSLGKPILVTGGSGYIGSHTCLELLNAGETVVVVDDLSNSSEESLIRVRKLYDQECDNSGCGATKLIFRKVDITDELALDGVFAEFQEDGGFHSCIHFAGLKAVGESVREPLKYYQNNIVGTLSLLKCMQKYDCRKLIFSSSATVYGSPEQLPLDESCRTGLHICNPYGKTKYVIEQILMDLQASDTSWRMLLLRYFNPVAAHSSGEIGEDPSGIPNNLMPFISQVAVGRRKSLGIFGNDYNTPDGTGIRDYLHVVDLAAGHLSALRKLESMHTGCIPVNLGTGKGLSVMDIVKGMVKACGKPIPYSVIERRPGDLAELYSDPSFAEKFLGWKATRGLDEMCRDTWHWQNKNPFGYGTTK